MCISPGAFLKLKPSDIEWILEGSCHEHDKERMYENISSEVHGLHLWSVERDRTVSGRELSAVAFSIWERPVYHTAHINPGAES